MVVKNGHEACIVTLQHVGKVGQLAQVPMLVPFPAVQLAALIQTPFPCLEMLDV
jgi:hypothetical protein